ncbi:hypothetical protein [Streptomyces sp. SAJ15]|uniref:hypothetical protein n=1 Tax=Streptomyces sp. SAJ15 TaxID=2011095 RepID=UPI00118523E9|nr:hypothetical protein [Streptomyces sp. SAJ15]TVL89238.1 hypothetical protein CD790_29160 [Streptomyces sp. SAJ15]
MTETPADRPERRLLVVVERGYRGTVETQFADVLYAVREFHQRSRGLDLLLRGLAAGYAVETDHVPAVRLGTRTLDTLPDPRASVRTLIDDGVAVHVEEPDLARLGRSAADRLLPGARRVAAHALTDRWNDYERVWFL